MPTNNFGAVAALGKSARVRPVNAGTPMTDHNNPNSPKPVAGYYPDAQGIQRYWDGNAWTEHTQQMPAAGPPPPNSTSSAKSEREWFKKKRFMIPIGLVVLGVIGSALGGGGEADPAAAADTTAVAKPADAKDTEKVAADKSDPKATEKPKAKPKPKPKAVKVEAVAMIQEYEDNELAADKKYKGKTIEVSGVVAEIDTEFFDTDQYVLRIGNGDEFEFLYVSCNDMSSEELETLTVGDGVTAVGKFDDGGDLGVELKKCKLS